MTTSGSPAGGFNLEFHGLQAEVILPVLGPGDVAPSATSILTALRASPFKSVDRAAIEDALGGTGHCVRTGARRRGPAQRAREHGTAVQHRALERQTRRVRHPGCVAPPKPR
ncbi:MAG: hypothetical protein EXR66_03290 [Dehalococcoidia bacterium]|nr:hypothetical protein [Dehalococcoidia bacterium]